MRAIEVETRDGTISSLISGEGPDQVVCLHGLGSNKTSFFKTISTLTPDHTVHAIDLPGFGSSSKPARAAYDASYFARSVLGYMDAMASIERTWWATRWAVASRSSSALTRPSGRRRSASWRRPWPFGAAASWCRW